MAQTILVSPTILCSRCRLTFTPEPTNQPVSSDIIRSHRPPTDSEIYQTKSLLEQDGFELIRYDEELYRIRGVLAKLEGERNALCKRIEERGSWLAPVRRLPAEILEDILDFAKSGSQYSLSIKQNTFESGVHILSQVCWFWRHTTMSRPTWWNRLFVDISHLSDGIVDLLNACLEYSSDDELSIYIEDSGKDRWHAIRDHGTDTYEEHLGKAGLRAFQALFDHASRIRDLVVDVPLDILAGHKVSKLYQRPGFNFPVLRSLAYLDEMDDIVDLDYWLSRPISAPMLAELIVSEVSRQSESWYRGFATFPFHQLFTLKVLNVYYCPLLTTTFLPRCTQLQRLSIGLLSNVQNISNGHILEIASLRHLTVTASMTGGTNTFFNSVKLPALGTFSFQPDNRSSTFEWPSAAFLGMIQRSDAALKAIYIDCSRATFSNVDGNQFFGLLKRCPDLGTLHIRVWNSDTLIALFQRLAHLGVRFSKLKDIDIETSDSSGESQQAIMKRTILGELLRVIVPQELRD
ncbi:hypothetical protein VNI00_007770 [Paramarasmius palmivorus]|uniref:F-box domain-containing protein n=1 Tax=Paramarasmius palmivorus TaxID=297713 RepID=A0AAW0CXJ5_9AGAR